MRNAGLALLVLLAGATGGRGQETGAWADKLFKERVHDFGTVPRGAELFHTFKMENIYAVPLQIIGTRVSCGCVTVTPGVQVLDPRKTGDIEIKMDARRFPPGTKSVSVYVTVGPQFVSTATLQVKAQSRADIVFNPGEINFGVVPRGQTPRLPIDVEYAGVLNWQVTEVVNNSPALDVQLKEVYRRPGQVGYRVEVALKPDAPPGTLKEELLLRTNDPASPLVPVLVEGSVQATLAVVPSVVNLEHVKLGETVTRRVIVRGSKPFRILGVEGLGEGVRADLPSVPAANQFLLLSVHPAKAGDLRRTILIRTDLDREAPVTLTLEGDVQP